MPRRRTAKRPKGAARSLVKSRNAVRSKTVYLDIPKSVSHLIPYYVVARAPRQRQLARRAIRVPLKTPRGPMVRRRIKVLYSEPRNLNPSSVEITRKGDLRIDSYRKARRLAAKEIRTPRRDEGHKGSSRDAHAGQIESTRRDSFGLIGANAHRSASSIMDAALVQNALTRL